MTLRTRIGLFIVAVLACTALLQRCNRALPTVKGPAQITFANGGDTLILGQHGKPSITVYQPDPKSTVITTDAKGNVTVKVRQFGVGFEPGIGVGYSNKVRLALDTRFVYFKRFSGHVGLGFSLDSSMYKGNAKLLDLVDPYVGVGYVPFLRFANTSIVGSYTATKHLFVFVRVRF